MDKTEGLLNGRKYLQMEWPIEDKYPKCVHSSYDLMLKKKKEKQSDLKMDKNLNRHFSKEDI